MRKKLVSLFLIFALLLSGTAFAADSNVLAQHGFEFVMQIANYIDQNYKFGITSEELKDQIIKDAYQTGKTDFDSMMFSMFSLLDEHSSYMPKETFERFMSSLEGSTAGIGVEMIVKNGRMVIRKVLEGSPAQKAGLQKRDVIAAVNGENVLDLPYSEAAGKISGPLGSTVQIGVLRGDSEDVLSFFLVRAITEENPVTLKIVDEKTAYIGLSSFTENAAHYVAEALAEVDRQGITKIIFDLRQNGGGYLTSAVKLADMLLPAGVFCYVEHKKPEDLETFYSQNQNPKYKLAILVDSGTASASELFSGSAQDLGAARLFGTKTYGKGTVQTIMPLVTGGGIRLTVGQYFTANKQNVLKNAIMPDVVVENTKEKVLEENLAPLSGGPYPKEGDVGQSVLALEQRLGVLGLFLDEPDEVFNGETADAVAFFQALHKLPATGEINFDTMFYLENEDYSQYFRVLDNQFNAAYDYLKNLAA